MDVVQIKIYILFPDCNIISCPSIERGRGGELAEDTTRMGSQLYILQLVDICKEILQFLDFERTHKLINSLTLCQKFVFLTNNIQD